MASAAGSLFARTYAGHTGVDPYTTAVSDVVPGSLRRGHLHRQGPLRRRRVRGRRSTGACRRTRCCRTISSRASTRERRSSPTSRSSTTIRRASSRTRDASIAGCAATGRSSWWLFPFVPSRGGSAAQSPAAHVALEDPRQPAAQPDGAGDAWRCSSSAGRSCRAARSPGRRSRLAAVGAAARVCGCSQLLRGPTRLESATAFLRTTIEDLEADARPRLAAAGVPRQPGLRDGARDHGDARASRHHEAPPARVGDGRGQRRTGRAAAPGRVRQGHDRQPRDRRRQPGCSSSPIRPHALRRVAARARAVGGGAAHRVRAQPAGADAPCGARRAKTASFSASVARKTWRYFETFVGPEDHALPPDNVQIVAGADHRAPHVADQHRDGAARDPRGARLRLHRHGRVWRAGSTPRSRPSRASNASKVTC